MFAIVNCATVWVREREFPEGVQLPFSVRMLKSRKSPVPWTDTPVTVTKVDRYIDEEPGGGRGKRVGDVYLALRLLKTEIRGKNICTATTAKPSSS